jgi:hypothetical protein
VIVEFSFDVAQIAGAGYLPATYQNFIGFQVAKDLLARAFVATYGLELKDLFLSEDLAIGTYRRAASEIIPRMTLLAWKKKKDEIIKLNPGITRQKFVYRLSRSNYEKQWGKEYKRSRFSLRRFGGEEPGLGWFARFLIFLIELLPKIGPLQTLKFKPPTPATQALFVQSFRSTLDRYQALLEEIRSHRLAFENKNLDTGKITRVGDYTLADKTYSKLLERLAEDHFKSASPELRNNILAFYKNGAVQTANVKDAEAWQRTLRELDEMKAGHPATAH